MKWIDLKSFGAELKRVELSNGTKFPALIITDVQKYEKSGAMSLAELKDNNNNVQFRKLPGKKGRALNQPIFFISTTPEQYKNKEYGIYENLSKVLNISKEELRQNYVTDNLQESEITLKNAFLDPEFEKLAQTIAQDNYGQTLYLVKDTTPPTSLDALSQKMEANQHPLFPKGDIARIPLNTLAQFGYDSSIVRTAFTSPDHALKAGHKLQDLDIVKMQGDSAVLPISVNKDSSINIIKNFATIPQLAYSGMEWKKNLRIIQDYQSIVGTRELCREILNTKASAISKPEDMEAHITKMAQAFQSSYKVANNLSSSKPIKFGKGNTHVFLAKNDANEWRYIEKTGPLKEDLPLNSTTFNRALDKLVNINHVVSDALNLESPSGDRLQKSLDFVHKNQLPAFDKFQKSNQNSPAPTLNADGSKVRKPTFDKDVQAIQPNRGETLFDQQVSNFLSSANESSNVFDTLGGGRPLQLDDLNARLIVEEPEEQSSDIALDALDNDQLKEEINSNAQEKEKPRDEILNQDFSFLPKGLKGVTEQNYAEINDTYLAVQYLNCTTIPLINEKIQNLEQLVKENAHEMVINANNAKVRSSYDSLRGFRNHLNQLSVADPELVKKQGEYQDAIDYYQNRMALDQAKHNILHYRLESLIGSDKNTEFGLSVINSNDQGEAIPFLNKEEYLNAKHFVNYVNFSQEALDAHGVPQLLAPNKVLDDVTQFVEQNFSSKATEPQNQPLADEYLPSEDFAKQLGYPLNDQPLSQFAKDRIAALLLEDVVKSTTSVMRDLAVLNPAAILKGDIYNTAVRTAYNTAQLVEGITKVDSFVQADDALRVAELSSSANLDSATQTKYGVLSKLRVIADVSNQYITQHSDKHTFALSSRLGYGYSNAIEALAYNTQAINRYAYGSFLLSTQDLEVQEKSADQDWVMHAADSKTPYKVEAFPKDENPDGSIVLDTVNTYKRALHAAYHRYQTNLLANTLGLTKSEMNAIDAIVANKDDPEKANKLISNFMGNDKLNLTNLDIKQEEYVSSQLTYQDQAITIAKVAMLGRALGVETDNALSDLTNKTSMDYATNIDNALLVKPRSRKDYIQESQNQADSRQQAINDIITEAKEKASFLNQETAENNSILIIQSNNPENLPFAIRVPNTWTENGVPDNTIDTVNYNSAVDIVLSSAINKAITAPPLKQPVADIESEEIAHNKELERQAEIDYAVELKGLMDIASQAQSVVMHKSELSHGKAAEELLNRLANNIYDIDSRAADLATPRMGLFARGDKEGNFEYKLSGNKETSIELAQKGFVALADPALVASSVCPPNYLYHYNVLNFDREIIEGLTSQPKISNDLVLGNEKAMDEVEVAVKHTVKPSDINVPPFSPAIDPDVVISMKPSQIAEDVNLNSVWPQQSINTDFQDSASRDVALLGKLIREAAPKEVTIHSDVSLERNASVYIYTMNEIQKSLHQANSLESAIDNIAKANTRINQYAPLHFNGTDENTKNFKEAIKQIAEVAKLPNSEDLHSALKNTIESSPLLSKAAQGVASEIKNTLNSNDIDEKLKLTANPANAFVEKVAGLSTTQTNPLTPQSISEKWGVTLLNPKNKDIALQAVIINESFNKLHETLNGPNSGLPKSNMGKGITIQFGGDPSNNVNEIVIDAKVPKIADLSSQLQESVIRTAIQKAVEDERQKYQIPAGIEELPNFQAQTDALKQMITLARSAEPSNEASAINMVIKQSAEVHNANLSAVFNGADADLTQRFIRKQAEHIMGRQDQLLQQFDKKAKSLGDKKNVELLDYAMLSDSVNKIANARINTNNTAIQKFVTDQMPDNPNAVEEIKFGVQANPEMVERANDVLHSNAVSKALSSMLNSFPDEMRSSKTIAEDIHNTFSPNFGSFAYIEESQRKSDPVVSTEMKLVDRLVVGLKNAIEENKPEAISIISEAIKKDAPNPQAEKRKENGYGSSLSY